ncbi:hypothetical protein JW906_04420 [bacterium]|nr:hypothetical protein [bacterium]
MNGMTLHAKRLRLAFGDSPGRIESLFHADTGGILCGPGMQSLLIRHPDAVSEPVLLKRTHFTQSGTNQARMLFEGDEHHAAAELLIRESEEGMRFQLKAESRKPIWLVEWKLSGLNLDRFIVPALGGQSVDCASMPPETVLSYKYPFWWNAQFVIGERGSGGVWFRCMDEGPGLKLLRIGKENGGCSVTLGFETDAPLAVKPLEAVWFMDGYGGDWKNPVDSHRRWMEKAFGPAPLEENSFFPSWARRIDSVLEIWGARKESPVPPHTFDQMIVRLQEWKNLHAPERTLVYLPGFAEHGIDSNAPDYNPSPELGGESKFRTLVDAAHGLGYRVMVHTNVLAMTFTHPLFTAFRKHQVVDPFGRPQGWGLDIDGDWLAEPYFAYINPGASEWGDLMESVIGGLVRKFGIDGVFLDQTLLAFNAGNGPNFVRGMREHILRLQHAFPGILFAGEGMHEQVLKALPMAQIHGIDSLLDTHGMEGQMFWRRVHPVSAHLFGRYVRFTAHLLTRHPTHPLFELQQRAYDELGVIPAMCLYNHDQAMDIPELRRILRTCRSRQP